MRIDIAIPLALSAILMVGTVGKLAVATEQDENREVAALQGAKASPAQAIAPTQAIVETK